MMNQGDRRKLDTLLRDLISAQDDVTHYNENGLDASMKNAQHKRDRIKRQIVEFVDALGRLIDDRGNMLAEIHGDLTTAGIPTRPGYAAERVRLLIEQIRTEHP